MGLERRRRGKRLVGLCLDGINVFDTADVYSNGLSEEIFGQAIQGRRHELLISTKATFHFGKGPNDVGSPRYHVIQACGGSLKRLRTDYIDICHMHIFDALTPVEEVLYTSMIGAQLQGPLHRLLELLWPAFNEIAFHIGEVWLGEICRASGLLLFGGP